MDLRKPVVQDDDYPTLNNAPRRSNGEKESATYSAPRGDSNYDNRRGGDHDRRDSYELPRRSGGGDYERRDSYERRGDSFDRRDSYGNRDRDGDAGRRGGFGGGDDRRDSYDNRRGGDFGREGFRRSSYDNRDENKDERDWRSGSEERREYVFILFYSLFYLLCSIFFLLPVANWNKASATTDPSTETEVTETRGLFTLSLKLEILS